MSLHGAPLLCLALEDKAQGIKKDEQRKQPASMTQNSDAQQDKSDDGHQYFEI